MHTRRRIRMRMLVLAAVAGMVPPLRRVDLNHADVGRVLSSYCAMRRSRAGEEGRVAFFAGVGACVYVLCRTRFCPSTVPVPAQKRLMAGRRMHYLMLMIGGSTT
jgi:hypothetical protein